MVDAERLYEERPAKFTCPSLTTFLAYTSLVVVVGAVLIPLEFNFGLLKVWREIDEKVLADLSVTKLIWTKLGYPTKSKNDVSDNVTETILIKEELKKYSGDSEVLYLAILGKVFDVTKGRRHYGKDGGYSFFTGIDASRSFVTGEFNEAGLIDNIEGLKPHQYLDLLNWLELYEKDYIYVGKVVGYFYNNDGHPTEGVNIFERGLIEGKKSKAKDEEDRVLFPECNSKWTKDTGAVVWCALKSGGVSREWVGYPRQYFKVGQTRYRCACAKDEYLSDPRFKEYDQCSPTAISCEVKS